MLLKRPPILEPLKESGLQEFSNFQAENWLGDAGTLRFSNRTWTVEISEMREIDQFLGEEKSAGLDGGENAHSSIRLSRRLYSCMQSEARIMLEPAAELLRILAVYRRKRRVLGDRKNI